MTTLLESAREFIIQFYEENYPSQSHELEKRLDDITNEIYSTQTYTHTFEELSFGARIAWRNSNRCIGRLSWESLTVFDHRHLNKAADIAQATFEYMEWAENKGKIRPSICVFAPARVTANDAGRGTVNDHNVSCNEIRFWNNKLVRYAGYELNGGVVGDSDEIAFTRECQRLGWEGAGTHFDLLPLVIQMGNSAPEFFEFPEDYSPLQVDIIHPEFTWFKELGLKWYAVPYISNMILRIGGIEYSAAPFNGWFMGTEIGTRNLADEHRYNKLPLIAEYMGLDKRDRTALWKDRALTELNTAVLHSFKKQGVTMVDHHTASLQFERFQRREEAAGRKVTADWAWIVPPTAGATTQAFHREWDNEVIDPNYYYTNPPYGDEHKPLTACPFHIGR